MLLPCLAAGSLSLTTNAPSVGFHSGAGGVVGVLAPPLVPPRLVVS